VEQALLRFGVQVIFAKMLQDISDMDLDEDVIRIDHYKDISHVSEDVVHKHLKHSGCIGESHWHDQELKGAVLVLCPITLT